MGQETGHHAVHQEREIFPSASFQIGELGAWTPSLQLVIRNNTTQGPSPFQVTSHQMTRRRKQAFCHIPQCSKCSSDAEAHARGSSCRNLTTGPDSG